MNRQALGFAIGLSIVAILLKLVNPNLPENFSLFYAVAIFSGCFLRSGWAWGIPLSTFILSDVLGCIVDDALLGSYAITSMALNYVGIALMIACGVLLRRNQNMFYVAGASIIGAALFFVISNFGAFLDSRMGYTRTWDGLVQCYTMAIPFARGLFSSSFMFSCAAFFAYQQIAQARPIASTEVDNVSAVQKSVG
jgi:hypothetical protein